MSLFIKICGVTRPDEALACAAAGADALGLNFYPRSPRYLAEEQADGIAAALREHAPAVLRVGVFVNGDPAVVRAAFARGWIDVAQLHGDEQPEAADEIGGQGRRLWKALRLSSPGDLGQVVRFAPPSWERLVLDAPGEGYGGSGRRIDTALARRAAAAAGQPVLLAGGLTPDNVAEAVQRVRPAGIDAASGVESAPGRKDPSLVAALIAAARTAAADLSTA